MNTSSASEPHLLLTPGPTQVPPSVLAKTALPMIHHRTKEFQAILARVNENLKKVFLTQHPVVMFSSSGTGAMEAALVNLASKGETVLGLTAGKWGERFCQIAKAYGLDLVEIKKPYSEAFTAEDVRAALKKYPKARLVLATLCETSTAVVNPIREIAQVTAASQALLLVDAISGLACDPLEMDAWGVDVVISGSQKGLMLPPGLAFLALNARALERAQTSDLPKFYFNLASYLKTIAKNDTPFTSAVSLIRGLDEALNLILAEGMPAVWKRHAAMAEWTRKQVAALGLSSFAKVPSSALTAIQMPEGIVSNDVIRAMRETHRVIMANGQGELEGKMVRLAHMGFCYPKDVERGFQAFKTVLESLKAVKK